MLPINTPLFVPTEQATNLAQGGAVDTTSVQSEPVVKKPSLLSKVKEKMQMFIPSGKETYIREEPIAPIVKETLKDIHGSYHILDTGTTVRPIKEKLAPAIELAYQSNPTIPRGVIEALLMKESSMGANASNMNPEMGKYAYLVGMTKIAKKELIRNGIVPDLNTPAGAIKAAADYWNLQDDKYTTPAETYNHWYSSGTLKPDQLQQFDDMVKYYAKKG